MIFTKNFLRIFLIFLQKKKESKKIFFTKIPENIFLEPSDLLNEIYSISIPTDQKDKKNQ